MVQNLDLVIVSLEQVSVYFQGPEEVLQLGSEKDQREEPVWTPGAREHARLEGEHGRLDKDGQVI